MARLTKAERASICALYKRYCKALDSQGIDKSPWRIYEYVGRRVGRDPQVVRDTLVAEGVIDPTPPRGVSDTQMTKIAADYLSGMSIRACLEKYGGSYGLIRKVLVYKRVVLRPRGGLRPRS